jgi:hypothetical protein
VAAHDWAALVEHAARAHRSSKLPADGPAPSGAVEVDRTAVGRFRARRTGLAHRAPGRSLADAAWGGLQDSAPRSAQLSLHARVEGVGPAAWEDPSLVQVWLRRSDFVVPLADVGVFTRGAMPRDPAAAADLERLADEAERALGGTPRPTREVDRAIEGLPSFLLFRFVSATGRIRIRWDASRIDAVPVPAPEVDDEEARVELLRRFFAWYGPVSVGRFARWAGVTREDAAETWRAVEGELVAVAVDGRARWVRAADLDELRAAADQPVAGVRLLPQNDPHLHLVEDVADEDRTLPEPVDVPSRLRNSLTGRLLVDGVVAGGWGRSAGDVTLDPWVPIEGARRDEVEAEAASFATALGQPMSVRWLDVG